MSINGTRATRLPRAARMRTCAALGLCLVLGICEQVLSGEHTAGVRAQLASLQEETGLTLSGVDYKYVLSVRFSNRSTSSEDMHLPGSRISEGALSPDGAEVAFEWDSPSRPVPGNRMLAILHRDGTGLREYPNIQIVAPPCWSPDKSMIVVLANVRKPGEAYREGLILLNLKSGAVEEIQPSGFVAPECWSPDGKQIVYSARMPSGRDDTHHAQESWRGIYTSVGIYDIAQKSWRELARGNEPSWSPDGNWIAFLDGDRYYMIRPSGTGRKLLLQAKELYGCLAWSPDSRFVAYAISHVSFMNPSRALRIRVRRLADGSDDWVGENLVLGTNLRWVQTPVVRQK